VAVGADGNFAWAPGKTVAFVGVEGLVVVDTPDALLVTTRERSEEVKEVVDRLRREEREDLL
jgi:mannose-1-phosphate guanylyltransferase